MADINATDLTSALEELKTLAVSGVGLGELTEYISKTVIKLKLGKEAAQTLKDEFVKVKETVTDLSKMDFSSAIQNWTDHLNLLGQKIKQIVPGISDLGTTIGFATPQFLTRTDIPKSFIDIGESAKDASADINESVEAISKVTGINSKWINALASSAEAGKKMEFGLVAMAAASGQLTTMIGITGDRLDNLPGKAESWSQMTQRIGNDVGALSPTVSKLANQLGIAIPGALNDIDKPGEIAGQRITQLQALMEVATGTGQSYETVVKDVIDVFETMGIQGTPALEFVARMQAASEAIGLPLKFVKQYATEAAGSFALFADDTKAAANMTQSAVNIMGRLGPALQQSGLGPKAVTDLVRGVTDGISKMDTAQKAFLSSQTGGSGGLQGAFQIDQMLAEGKIDQVFDKVKQNMMQKLGGPIVTRTQAAGSPEMAAQFQKQIMFMMSPAMGGMAKDQASAVKLLEAMASGKAEMPEGMQDKDKTLKDTMDRGAKLQERGNSKLTEISNYTKRMAELGALSNAGLFRELFGSESKQFNRESVDRRGSAVKGVTVSPFDVNKGRTVGEVASSVGYKDEAKKVIDSIVGYTTNFAQKMKDKGMGQRSPVPGAPEIDVNTLRPFSTKSYATNVIEKNPTIQPATIVPPNPNKLAARTLDKNEIKTWQPKQKESTQVVQVAVTTVCAVCQRKVAADEAGKVIDHSHNKANRQNWMGSPNP